MSGLWLEVVSEPLLAVTWPLGLPQNVHTLRFRNPTLRTCGLALIFLALGLAEL